MRFFDAGQEAHGFIAVGQIATGVFAFGQMATGVVAVGQVARGVFAVGQGAIGLVTLGMGSAGLAVSVGMIGVGGRGFGLVLPLTPTLGPVRTLPDTVSGTALTMGTAPEGWVRGTLVPEPLQLSVPGATVRMDARWRRAAAASTSEGPREVLARIERRDEGLVAVELMAIPRTRLSSPRWWALWTLQGMGLVALAGVIWVLALAPVISLFGLARYFPFAFPS